MTTTANPVETREADPLTVNRWLASGEAVLIDVREPDEHARERIAGARLMPLSRFDAGALVPLAGKKVVMHCRSGRRSVDACRLAGGRGAGLELYSLTGGIDAWKKHNLPVEFNAAAPRMSILRQVQLTAGTIVLIGCALAWFVHPGWIGLAAFIGAGLTFAGASGTCGMAALLSRMPWNRVGGR